LITISLYLQGEEIDVNKIEFEQLIIKELLTVCF